MRTHFGIYEQDRAAVTRPSCFSIKPRAKREIETDSALCDQKSLKSQDSEFQHMKQIHSPAQAREEVLPEYYVLLCARRYAGAVKKLALAVTDNERKQHRKSLRYLLESGMIEAERERERRLRRYSDDFRRALVEKDGSMISRAISLEEAEIVRDASSIPPIASVGELSADDMDGWLTCMKAGRKAV
ncbi:hypothetical protein [Bradyrhizobium liaoningense]|uniref:hypothetical protein n=1 Tax=Bradyrhizobium liaoningense TaxID=43992 RepID=UPI001BAC9E7C|nr:hypothetical protein [Bradyrhizobium liaoningense]MBR1065232.1 hypothetical protein [Bradyrhizobium liaoningense]